MSVVVAEELLVLHTIPGRLRVHLSGWEGKGKRRIETELRQIQGVQRVQANPLTGNMLVQFDPALTTEQAILAAVSSLELNRVDEPEQPPPPPTVREKQGGTVRARIAVRGLDRDPRLAKRILQHLEIHHPKVRASANSLTGRVLVEFEEHETELDDLCAEVVAFELPDLPDEDHPDFPLDPGPLIQGAARTIGATLGFGVLGVRRLVGIQEPLPAAQVAIQVASVLGIVQGLPRSATVYANCSAAPSLIYSSTCPPLFRSRLLAVHSVSQSLAQSPYVW